jgi:hypothetical protein
MTNDSISEQKREPVRQPASSRAQLDAAVDAAAVEVRRLTDTCSQLMAELRSLQERLTGCVDENRDLRESALLWIELYTRQLERANALAEADRSSPDSFKRRDLAR